MMPELSPPDPIRRATLQSKMAACHYALSQIQMAIDCLEEARAAEADPTWKMVLGAKVTELEHFVRRLRRRAEQLKAAQ